MAIPTAPFIPRLLGLSPTGDLGPLTIYTNKRGRIVAYPKAPPKEPPTYWQKRMRNRFRLSGNAWRNTPKAKQKQWQLAAHRTGAAITGYNLFLYYQLTNDLATIQTIQRQTFTTLIP